MMISVVEEVILQLQGLDQEGSDPLDECESWLFLGPNSGELSSDEEEKWAGKEEVGSLGDGL